MANDTAIETRGLSRRFGSGPSATLALDRLDLRVARGEVLGLLGHNGAGKTTTVRLLNGLLRASAGEARVLGMDPYLEGARLRERSGVLTETPALDERLDATEALLGFGRIYGIPAVEARRRSARLLEEFGLQARAREPVRGFSKGMKQRLALARTLLHDPELLFLDEPTAGLDPVAARDVHELITRLAGQEGRTVVLCTHNLVEAQRLCQRVAVLQRGRLVALGSPEELAERLATRQRLTIATSAQERDAVVATLRASEGDAAVRAAQEPGLIAVEGVPREAVPALVARLVAAGYPLYAVVPDAPDLEDVYFALLAGEDGAAETGVPGAEAHAPVGAPAAAPGGTET